MRKPDYKGLTKLARELRKVPRREFNMDTYYQTTACGTAACILGWASVIFPARFRRVHDGPVYNPGGDFPLEGSKAYSIRHRRSDAEGELAFAAGFRVPFEVAEEIVYNHTLRTPLQASRYLTKVVSRLRTQERKAKRAA